MAATDVERVRTEMNQYRGEGFAYHSSGMDRHLFEGRHWRRYIKNERREVLPGFPGVVTVVYTNADQGGELHRASYPASIDENGCFWRASICLSEP